MNPRDNMNETIINTKQITITSTMIYNKVNEMLMPCSIIQVNNVQLHHKRYHMYTWTIFMKLFRIHLNLLFSERLFVDLPPSN